MARKSTGSVVEKSISRGTSYGIRFPALGARQWSHVGYSTDGVTREQAERELAYTLEQVRRGEWQPDAEPEMPREVPTFHAFASEWLEDRRRELRATTLATYEWELTHHLLPEFARMRVDAIGVEEVDRYRRRKVAQAEGTPGRLGATSINKTIGRLGQILDVAQERGWIVQNPVRVNPRNRKVRQTRPVRPWLEPDQVVTLLDAAGDLDREVKGRALPISRPLLATMAWAGLRVGEATALRWRHVSLANGRITVDESKTDAGVRDVDIQPELHDELITWRASTPFADEDDFVFPTGAGHEQNRHNVRKRVVLRSAATANVKLEASGRPPLPDALSPHAMRRSFASWLIAEGEDVAYVMAQMGHEDPSMTLGVYARAVRSGRRSARSARRVDHLDRAPAGTGVVEPPPVDLTAVHP